MKTPTSPQKKLSSQGTSARRKNTATQSTQQPATDLQPTVLDPSEELMKPATQDASIGMQKATETLSAQDVFDYQRDFFERSILFWDTLRQRANNMLEHERVGLPPLLDFKYETVLDARSFERPVNYALLRITEIDEHCWDDCVDPEKPPVIIVDPRAGHGPGIGGFKRDSEVGMAMREGHPVYFVIFFPEPTLGQTLADVLHVLRRFAEEVWQASCALWELSGRVGSDAAVRRLRWSGRTGGTQWLAFVVLGWRVRRQSDASFRGTPWRQLVGASDGRPGQWLLRRGLAGAEFREPQARKSDLGEVRPTLHQR